MEHLKAGRTFTELEVRQLAKDLLEILIYLHGRQPLVIHRDIKPSNILLTTRSGNSVGQVYLVDFGSVQTLAAKEGGTMTVVGTYGYMPPEQFGGRATPASDLYSLGATVIYLVTGMHPADLPQKDLQIQFKQAANLSPAFASWLKWMTQPSLDKRLTSAQEALQVLEQEQQRDTAPLSDRKPIGSTVLLTKNADSLEILTRSMRVGIRRHRPHNPRLWDTVMAMSIAVFSVVFQKLPLLMCSILISGLITLLFARFSRTRLHIDQQQISLTQELFGFKHNLLRPARRQDILMLNRTREVEQIPFETKVYIKPGIILWVGTQKIEIGSDGLLTEPEINWLAQELSDWLGLPITKE